MSLLLRARLTSSLVLTAVAGALILTAPVASAAQPAGVTAACTDEITTAEVLGTYAHGYANIGSSSAGSLATNAADELAKQLCPGQGQGTADPRFALAEASFRASAADVARGDYPTAAAAAQAGVDYLVNLAQDWGLGG